MLLWARRKKEQQSNNYEEDAGSKIPLGWNPATTALCVESETTTSGNGE